MNYNNYTIKNNTISYSFLFSAFHYKKFEFRPNKYL